MARFVVAAVLVLGLGGCAADDGGGAVVEAAIHMSMGEEVVGQGRDEVNLIPMEMPGAADTTYWASDHTLPARIYHLPEDPGEFNLSFEDMSIFDVTSGSRTDPGLVERLPPGAVFPGFTR